MRLSNKWHGWLFAGWMLSVVLHAGVARAAAPASDDPVLLLKQADKIKTSNNTEFVALIQRLDAEQGRLSQQQLSYLQFLHGWLAAYRGKFEDAFALLDGVVARSADVTLRFRSEVVELNALVISGRYVDAFTLLNRVLDQLPRVTDQNARIQALGTAGVLYSEAGQYDLAATYAGQMLKESSNAQDTCKGEYLKSQALFEGGKLRGMDPQLQHGIDVCVMAREPLWGNYIRYFAAAAEIQHGQSATAIDFLQKSYAEVQATRYPPLIAEFDAALAQAYWNTGESALAGQYADDAVRISPKGAYTQSLATAYKLQYLIAKKRGDMAAALALHEKYMEADKGYLTDVSAKALAYQTVAQQVLAKKQQIDALNKQNRILELQQALDRKAAEASRLSIILLLAALGFIAFLTYRIKRSQLRFMTLAHRDGLTGVFNRQHFVTTVTQQLEYCRKSSREACLVLLDMDHFKSINDNHGHAVGDRALQRAVKACQAHLRSTDVLGRLGGEEFGILLPECTLAQASMRAEQIREAIAASSGEGHEADIAVSASLGIADTARYGYDLRELLIRADEGLYQAKRDGRNRVCIAADDKSGFKNAPDQSGAPDLSGVQA
jgi:diguanylate cyclase (GGDEF)-like protein